MQDNPFSTHLETDGQSANTGPSFEGHKQQEHFIESNNPLAS